MGFFSRSKKVKKESMSPVVQDQQWATSDYQFPALSQLSHQPSQTWYPGDYYHSQAHFQSTGLVPSSRGWNTTPHHTTPSQQSGSYPSIIVNQHHYYLAPPSASSPPQRPSTSSGHPSKLNLGSVLDLASGICSGTGVSRASDDGVAPRNGYKSQLLNQGAALCDQISDRFNDVLTLIDGECYDGNERDLFSWQPSETQSSPSLAGERSLPKTSRKEHRRDHPKGQTTAVAASVISGNYFAKVELYANSRLPMDLPPLKLYIPTYPLLCLAAQYSERVYERPTGAERDAHVDADWRTGTKAMVIKSVPMDYMNTIVFAIRGTSTFMDWAVNLNTEPKSPRGFLDDPGNLCHAGFLTAARKMVAPVARRLRQLLEEDPGRASYSLLITGHSAGGAVATLLYSHMLATSKAAMSELNILTGCFKRIHCITFGTPPVSLIPLQKPADCDRHPHLRKSLFLSFINEGDPVARADKAYVRSLMELLSAPAPLISPSSSDPADGKRRSSREKASKSSLLSTKSSKSSKSTSSSRSRSSTPIWKVPPSTLSSAGRIIVLRSGDPKARLRGKKTVGERLNEGVVAHIATDEQLRQVIWGDPVAHVMKLYAGRIETLAVGAVTAKGY
ncbi:Alpha/Beta hydrolase protein [Apodospora peruviana]|uniref:Alpha/Beta hydrolase protein n=1 Tax=Apodospora peruviana TaxID=516989 RepID=A0AAE0IJD7_9PEZI|nr:Alpha/Beta hydrolase protein [Apodospora peruviana]